MAKHQCEVPPIIQNVWPCSSVTRSHFYRQCFLRRFQEHWPAAMNFNIDMKRHVHLGNFTAFPSPIQPIQLSTQFTFWVENSSDRSSPIMRISENGFATLLCLCCRMLQVSTGHVPGISSTFFTLHEQIGSISESYCHKDYVRRQNVGPWMPMI